MTIRRSGRHCVVARRRRVTEERGNCRRGATRSGIASGRAGSRGPTPAIATAAAGRFCCEAAPRCAPWPAGRPWPTTADAPYGPRRERRCSGCPWSVRPDRGRPWVTPPASPDAAGHAGRLASRKCRQPAIVAIRSPAPRTDQQQIPFSTPSTGNPSQPQSPGLAFVAQSPCLRIAAGGAPGANVYCSAENDLVGTRCFPSWPDLPRLLP